MSRVLQPAFVAGDSGRLFVSCFAPAGGTDTWLLFVPPFAEEMNKSRRMMARLGHALAARGIGVALPDLYGTGDSEGEFGDATLTMWQQDLVDTAEWLVRQHDCRNLLVGGLRYGALLAMATLSRLPSPATCLLWQPVSKGQQQLTQFLRLRLAAGIMGGGAAESLTELQGRLARGETLEVAGYDLAPGLAQAMAPQELAALAPPVGVRTHWLELCRDPLRPVTPASAQVIEAWRSVGADVRTYGVAGDPFWSTQELVDAPALVEKSAEILARATA